MAHIENVLTDMVMALPPYPTTKRESANFDGHDLGLSRGKNGALIWTVDGVPAPRHEIADRFKPDSRSGMLTLPEALEVVRTASRDCRENGHTGAANELLDALAVIQNAVQKTAVAAFPTHAEGASIFKALEGLESKGLEQDARRVVAVHKADAHVTNVGLPSYSDLLAFARDAMVLFPTSPRCGTLPAKAKQILGLA